MKRRYPYSDTVSPAEYLRRMQAGESLREGSARAFRLWHLGHQQIVVLGNDVMLDERTSVVTSLYVAGRIAETTEDNGDGITFYRPCSDDEAERRREHISRWGVLDLHAQDRKAAQC